MSETQADSKKHIFFLSGVNTESEIKSKDVGEGGQLSQECVSGLKSVKNSEWLKQISRDQGAVLSVLCLILLLFWKCSYYLLFLIYLF